MRISALITIASFFFGDSGNCVGIFRGIRFSEVWDGKRMVEKKAGPASEVAGPGGHSPAVTRVSLVGLHLCRARLRFAGPFTIGA